MEKSFKQLIVWQRSIELVKAVYEATNSLPRHELYGLTAQIRRAAVSIPSNIAEGYKRRSLGQYRHFLNIAEASSAELETQIIICKEIYPTVDFNQANLFLTEIEKMLFSLISRLSE